MSRTPQRSRRSISAVARDAHGATAAKAELDERFMRRALVLAARARGRTSPNPMVGAVIVAPGAGQRVVAEGFHARAGTDHGEVAALRKLGFRAPGATLYVTLEPCDHTGRTGPCTEAILSAGIRRVVIGMRDPHVIVNGRGIRKLRARGIDVTVGVLEAECRAQNRDWLTFVSKGRPYVILKAAVTLDGFLATRTGDARWVSGEASRAAVHALRDRVDAVVVGARTAMADDPALTTRLAGGRGRDALRVVVDGRLSLSPRARLFSTGRSPVVVIAAKDAPLARERALQRAGAEVVRLSAREGRVPARTWLAKLAARDVVSVMVEGGGELHAQLLRAGLVDELVLFVAPKLLGGDDGVPLFRGPGARVMADALALRVAERRVVGDDMMLVAFPLF